MVNVGSFFYTLVIKNFEADRTGDVGKSEDRICIKELCSVKEILGFNIDTNIDDKLC